MKRIYYFIILAVAATVTMYSCLKQEAPDPQVLDLAAPPNTEAAMAPPDSTKYRPVAWGAPLKIVKNTLTHRVNKFGPSWQAMVFANSKIAPTNYLQDWLKERIVFADSALVTYDDTLYLCVKVK